MVVVATLQEYALAKEYSHDEIIVTGVGGLNVIRALKDIDRDTPILNIGYVGSNNIAVGTVVTVDEVALYHPSVTYDEPNYKIKPDDRFQRYKCFTSNNFVLETNIKESVVFDMELAYIMALGFKNVKCIKVVSDNLSLKEYERNVACGE